jgi:hypothetical protein
MQRHIIVDVEHRVVNIQVMYHGEGRHNMDEFTNIENGDWVQYCPKELQPEIARLVSQGFRLCPIHLNFGAQNKGYYVLEFCELRKKEKNVLPFHK